nr:hypothetical protein [Streptomyces violaceusniger]
MARNPVEVDDVSQATARLLLALLRFLLPPVGRHRASDQPPLHRPVRAPRVPAPRGEDIGLVRPYLVAHERRREARQQRARRRALWLAVHGIDIGPRRIHGVEVSV